MRLLTIAMLLASPGIARAFCGFYVGGADTKLFNEATEVAIMRHGTQTVLSMSNHYDGPPENFAMVVPVPVVLKKENVKTLKHEVFSRIDQLTAPRLVEYWEQDPCPKGGGYGTIGHGSGTGSGYGVGSGRGGMRGRGQVVVEAEFAVGEYDIVILSANDSVALDAWLRGNGYKIPAGAAPVLKPYVAAGMKFFVAKVNVKKIEMENGRAILSPLRVAYDSPIFSLPIRLGMINARGKQDLIVYLLGETRFEAANRKNVTIPTNLIVKEETRASFGELYAALFDAVTAKNPGAAVTEYVWDTQSCDPCPGPVSGLSLEDVQTLGGDVIPTQLLSGRTLQTPSLRIGLATVQGSLDKAIVRRYIRQKLPRLMYCVEKQVVANPSLRGGTLTTSFTIAPDGTPKDVKASGIDPTVDACARDTISSIQFPKTPKKDEVQVTYPFVIRIPGAPGPAPKGAPMQELVVTRLHLRYGAESLGDDLVFRSAKAIEGGTGVPDEKGRLATAVNLSSNIPTSQFQGRYVILHPWTGKIACKKPQRGVWGYPPDGKGDPSPKPATDTAFVKRRGLKLSSLVVDGLPPELSGL